MSEEQLFLAALDQPDASARAAYLDEMCGVDTGIRRQVEALLATHFRSGEFLDVPAVEQIQAGSTGDNTITLQGDSMASDRNADDGLHFLMPSTRPDSLGRIGHYEVLQVLGKGGFGIVFRAFDDVLQRVVAVKVMTPEIATLSPARKRFLREARSSAAVRHENVVQVYEVGEQPLPYLVMEFIPGETLQQKLDRNGPLAVTEVLQIGRQIAEGLTAAHATDLIHRDIKPANVLIEGGQHRVKITDFGLARAADDASISQSGIIAGTPMYMAPEQAKGEKLDQRADLFSLGSVLYQMASGRAPFRASNMVAVLKRVAEDTPRPIREIIPETPQWLCDVIAKLHAKNPDERYQSAREVADVLADCEAQLKVGSKLKDFTRIPRSKQPTTGQTRVRWKWAAAAVVLLPLIALAATEFAGLTHLFRRQPAVGPIQPVGGPTLMPVGKIADDRETELQRTALQFDGGGSVDIPSLKLPTDGPYTMEGFFSPNVEKAGGPQNHTMGVPSQSYLNYTPNGYWRWVATGSGNPKDNIASIRARPGPQHVACVYDGKQRRFYLNGQLTERPASPLEVSSVRAFELGTFYFGTIDEVRVSKVARYPNNFTPSIRFEPDADTLALYHCDEGQGDVLKDSSGNGHHGKIVGAKWVKVEGPPIPAAQSVPLPPTFKNTIGMEFAIVPKGKSWLGGGKDKLGDTEVEIPADFYLGKYHVTQEEWEKVMEDNPSYFSRKGAGKDELKDISDADLKRFPVDRVTWDACQIFVARLNKREKDTGWVYRLPKEVEWEYACRGGPMADKLDSAFDFYFAKPTNAVGTRANLNTGTVENPVMLGRTCKVGMYEPNVLGLHDMYGNLAVWCDDAAKTYDGFDGYALRGGSWNSPAEYCRAACRLTRLPSNQSQSTGLRLARVPSGAPSPEAKTPPLAVAPFTDADVKRIAALSAAEQVEEVRKELVRRNPGFDGKVEHKIEGGVVTEIKVVTDKVTDIAPIRVFNALRVLDLSGTEGREQVNGQLADLTPLKGMNFSSLTRLDLSKTKIDDAGLAYFKDCKNLKNISLKYTKVTDAGLANFKDCKDLIGIDLGGLQVTDQGLANFKDCKELNDVWLNETQVTDKGLAYFKDCRNLTMLHMGGTQVTDAGLVHLKSCKQLTTLFLEWTKVTDAGLLDLAGLDKLTYLYLKNTKVTANAVEGLAKALPRCKITWDGGVIEPK